MYVGLLFSQPGLSRTLLTLGDSSVGIPFLDQAAGLALGRGFLRHATCDMHSSAGPRAQPYRVLMTTAPYIHTSDQKDAPLARLSLAKVFIWALKPGRISARLAAPKSLPPSSTATPPFGTRIILRHSRIWLHSGYSQTGASVAGTLPCSRGRTAHVFVRRPLTSPVLASPSPLSWRLES